MDRDIHLQGIYTSLLINPSMFPHRVPMDRDTLSPEPLVYLFIHSCMSAGVPKKQPCYIWAENIRSPHTEPMQMEGHIQWGAAWFPQEPAV